MLYVVARDSTGQNDPWPTDAELASQLSEAVHAQLAKWMAAPVTMAGSPVVTALANADLAGKSRQLKLSWSSQVPDVMQAINNVRTLGAAMQNAVLTDLVGAMGRTWPNYARLEMYSQVDYTFAGSDLMALTQETGQEHGSLTSHTGQSAFKAAR